MFKMGPDHVFCHCLHENEVYDMLFARHHEPYGGHCTAKRTAPKILLLRFGYLGKWFACVCESLNTKGEIMYLVLCLYVLISL
jgi:hypothetical protein